MRKNNEDIINKLELLEECAHISPDKALLIVQTIINKNPLKTKVTRVKGFGNIEGKSHEDVLKKCIDILNKIRYLETKGVFAALQKIVDISKDKPQKDILKAFENLSQYNLFAIKQIGYKTQELILKEISKWKDQKVLKNLDQIMVIGREFLKPEFEGHSMPDYKTFTLHTGPLPVTDELKSIRKRTISMLCRAYGLTSKLDQRTKILQVLSQATHPPHHHLYEKDMEKMVNDDTNTIIDFYIEILPNSDNELIQDIEEQKIWFIKRFKKENLPKIELLEEKIDLNRDYGMFKVFVGYDGRLDPDYDFNKDQESRTKKVKDYLLDISEETFKKWQKKILLVVKNYSDVDPGGYSYFYSFLEGLGKDKPDLAIRLIEENEKELTPFLASILAGIWKSQNSDAAKEIIQKWIKAGKHLNACAFVFSLAGEADVDLIGKVFSRAKDLKDLSAMNYIIRSITQLYAKYPELKAILIKAIQELSKQNNFWWANNIWFKFDTMAENFTEEDFDIILNSLLQVDNIDYHSEALLKPIAKKYPLKVIDFFHRRVEIKSKKKRVLGERYDAIPYHLDHLREAFKESQSLIIPALLSWYKDGGAKNKWLYQWEASQILEKFFPGFNSELEKSLINLINKGDKESRSIVFSIIGKYEGEEFLWGVIKAMVQKYKDTKEYNEVRGHLMGYLSQTGVVAGEDGFVRAYKQKKDSAQKFKSDEILKSFVKDYEGYLEKRIIDEQKRTNEDIELMRRGLR